MVYITLNYIFKFVAKIYVLLSKIKIFCIKVVVSLNSLAPFINFDFRKSVVITLVKRLQLNPSDAFL